MDSALEADARAKLTALVENSDEDARVQFSTDLTPGDRFHIHEMAESMALFTLSLGEGPYRYISVYKKEQPKPLPKVKSSAQKSSKSGKILYDSATNYARSMNEVLNMERDAEHEQSTGLLVLPRDELVARGVAVVNLRIDEVSVGLYGRTIVEFTSVRPLGKEDTLPTHKLSSGSIVGVFDGNHAISPAGAAFVGTVCQVRPKYIQVLFDDSVEFDEGELSGRIHLCSLGSNATFNRNAGALKDLENGKMLEWNSSLQNCCFGLSEPRFHSDLRAMDSALRQKAGWT